jgi:hypothetical protein
MKTTVAERDYGSDEDAKGRNEADGALRLSAFRPLGAEEVRQPLIIVREVTE